MGTRLRGDLATSLLVLLLSGALGGCLGEGTLTQLQVEGSELSELESDGDAEGAFSLTPLSLVLDLGQSFQFQPTGGVPPYQWTVMSGFGSVSSSGLYTAGVYEIDHESLRVQDQLGATIDINVFLAPPGGSFIPSDTSFSNQWGMNNGLSSESDINAPEAWGLNRDCVQVAVSDTGVDLDHPDLQANLNTAIDKDFARGDAEPEDEDFHGTHVSGIVGAVGNNTQGVSGVCQSVQTVALKIFKYVPGEGGSAGEVIGSCLDGAGSIQYAIDKKIKVLNTSWSCPFSQSSISSAIAQLPSSDTLLVAAAGNNSLDIDDNKLLPASSGHSHVLTVASSNRSGGFSNFSNFGAQSVDIAAPGGAKFSPLTHQIYSTMPNPKTPSMQDIPSLKTSYDYLMGTSMSAPHVAGAAALLRNWEPHLSATEVKSRILDRVTPKSTFSGKMTTPGILNLEKMIDPSEVPSP